MTTAQKFGEQPPVQTQIKMVDVAPEGYIKAPFGQIVVDKNGFAYIKYTVPTLACGWRLLLGIAVFNTFAEMLAYECYRHNDVALVRGADAVYDFGTGAGWYVYDSTDTTASDNATTRNNVRPDDIAADETPGRWRMFSPAAQNT